MLAEANVPSSSRPEVPGIASETNAQDLVKVSRKTISNTHG